MPRSGPHFLELPPSRRAHFRDARDRRVKREPELIERKNESEPNRLGASLLEGPKTQRLLPPRRFFQQRQCGPLSRRKPMAAVDRQTVRRSASLDIDPDLVPDCHRADRQAVRMGPAELQTTSRGSTVRHHGPAELRRSELPLGRWERGECGQQNPSQRVRCYERATVINVPELCRPGLLASIKHTSKRMFTPAQQCRWHDPHFHRVSV